MPTMEPSSPVGAYYESLWRKAEQERKEAIADRDDLMRKLVNLTPGGSEFAFNPDGCVKWLEDERRGNHQLIVEKTAALHGAQSDRDANWELYLSAQADAFRANNFLNETKTALRNLVDAIVASTKAGPVLTSHRIDKAVAEALAVLEEVENGESNATPSV